MFVRASGEPMNKGRSGAVHQAGYEKFVKPAIQKATAAGPLEETWVLGLKSDPARLKDIALGGPQIDKVKRLYFEEFIKTYDLPG